MAAIVSTMISAARPAAATARAARANVSEPDCPDVLATALASPGACEAVGPAPGGGTTAPPVEPLGEGETFGSNESDGAEVSPSTCCDGEAPGASDPAAP